MLDLKLPKKVAGGPVPRTVPDNWESTPFSLRSGYLAAFINDASIPRADYSKTSGIGSLFADISTGLKIMSAKHAPFALLVNVNRGILVEEASLVARQLNAHQEEHGKLACQILKWLASPATQPGKEEAVTTTVPVTPAAPYYGQIEVADSSANGRTIRIHAVFLDSLSLLEPAPKGQSGGALDFAATAPTPSRYQTLGRLVSKDVTRDITSAGQFFKTIVHADNWQDGGCRSPAGVLCAAHARCPFAQNARWLQQDELRHRFLDMLRAAEIAGGKRFTYRELLEHMSLAVLGKPAGAWLAGKSPCSWVADQLSVGQTNSSITALAARRIYSNLFSDSDESALDVSADATRETVYLSVREQINSRGASRPSGFVRAFRQIDPSRDVDGWEGARSRALDAIESLDVLSPSTQAALWPELSSQAHSEIETTMDQVLREEIATDLTSGTNVAAQRVRTLRRWRALAMLRQYGLACGRVSFGDAIQSWLAEQESALRDGPRSGLGDGVHRLIMPSTTGQRVYLAPLRPRTYCIVGRLPKNTVLAAFASNDLEVVIVPHGDSLLAEVQINRTRERKAPSVLAILVVDLAIAREAMMHATHQSSSFTEIGHTAFARIERARASLISRARSARAPVYFTDELETVFSLAPAHGPAPLRVQPVT